MPVMPDAMSSTSSSPGALSLGEVGLKSPGGREGREQKRGAGRGTGEGKGKDKRREDVKTVVDGGGEGRLLYFGCKEPRWSGRLWWKEADKLNNLP